MDRIRCAALLAASTLVALTSGCLEEKTTVAIHANGSGKFTVVRKFSEDFTKQNFAAFKTDAEKADAARKGAISSFSPSQGIVAWTELKGTIEGGRLVQRATGYFEDVTKVKLSDVMGGVPTKPTFTWTKNADGGFTVLWGQLGDDDLEKSLDKKPTPDEEKQTKSQIEALKGLSFERVLSLPGAVAQAKRGATVDGSSARMASALKDMTDLMDLTGVYREKVAKKEMTRDAALADLKARGEKVLLVIEATCGPPSDAAADADFAKELAQAKASYPTSEIAKELGGGQPQPTQPSTDPNAIPAPGTFKSGTGELPEVIGIVVCRASRGIMRQPRGTAIVVGFGSEDKVVRLDLKTARVAKLTDDKGTDLLAGVNMAGKIRCEILGKNVNVEFHTPIVPAEGATKLRFEAEFSVVVEHDGKETVKGMGITTDVGVGF